MRLSRFINAHIDEILVEWDSFARKLGPAADVMSDLALRDHAKQMLQAIAADIDTHQSRKEQFEKSNGLAPQTEEPSAAAVHGELRHDSEFSVLQLSAEFRALRATVLRQWLPTVRSMSADTAEEMIRFNEAIDQALAESLATFSARSAGTRDLFLAILGHDLRAPLASMAASGDLLKRKLGSEAVFEVASRVSRGAGLMNRMVEDLIEYTRTQMGGRMPISLQDLDVGDSLARAVEDTSAAYPSARLKLATAGDLQGCFDGVRLHQLFTNLLSNAAQHGSKERPIGIEAEGQVDAIVVRITNHGPTIPEASLRSIFKPLVQLQVDQEENFRPRTSLGLGLFVARETAIAHGGDVTVGSGIPEGTTFTVRLPRRPPARGQLSQREDDQVSSRQLQ